MNSVVIEASELPQKGGGNNYDISSETYLQICQFYADSSHSQKNIYIVNSSSIDCADFIVSAETGTYRNFGIYFSGDIVRENREYILFLDEGSMKSVDDIKSAVQRQKAEFGCDNFRYCVIEKTYEYSSLREADNEMLREVFPFIVVLNKGFPQLAREEAISVRFPDKKYFDLSVLFNRNFMCSDIVHKNVSAVKSICEELLATKGIYDIYYLDTGKMTRYKKANKSNYLGVYHSIAAYFTIAHNFCFELNRAGEDSVLYNVSKFVSREFNYLDEYLRLVQNPLDFALIKKNSDMYFCMKNHKALKNNPKRYAVTFGVFQADFSLETKTLISNHVESCTYEANVVETVSIADLFQLNSADWTTASDGLRRLDKVLVEFERALNKRVVVSDHESLGITNVLIFKFDGKCKIGYVPGIFGTTPYSVVPVDAAYAPFVEEIDISQYPYLYDLNVAGDSYRFMEAFKKMHFISGDNIHYELPDYAKGIVLSDMRVFYEALKNCTSATMEEFGIWYPVLRQFRGSNALALFKYVLPVAARESGLLTYYGGPLTLESSEFSLGPKSWR